VKYRVDLHPEAERELRRAFEWLRERSPGAAERWRQGLLAKARTLGSFPERCPIAPESKKLGHEVRQLLYGRRSGRYRLLFVVHRRTVTVLHVKHGAQQRH